MSKSFNVVIATAGRPSLQTMIDSIAPQLTERDYLTIIWDSLPFAVKLDTNANVIQIVNPEPLGYWGHGSRTRWQNELPGDYLMNADDDDIYLPDSMEVIREHSVDQKLYVFKIYHGGFVVPLSDEIRVGNIGTPCGVYPNTGELPEWPFVYGGDGMFYESLAKQLPVEFIDRVIYAVKGEIGQREKEEPPSDLICKCGGRMTEISVGGKASVICVSCRREIEL